VGVLEPPEQAETLDRRPVLGKFSNYAEPAIMPR
jgi:hypothetical protein